MGAVYWPRQIP